MRALVTGCAGFIGSHLTESLLARGDGVLGVDCFNDNYGRPEKLTNLSHAQQWDDFEFVPIDLARGDLADLVSACDVIFHLAAEPGVRASWGQRFELYLRNNVLATQHLLEAARSYPEKRFVLASSSSIYGQAETFPTREDVTPQPFSPYGTTKLAAEHLCQLYHGNHGVQTVVLRYFSVYGPRQRPDMAFNLFCRAALSGAPVTVFGNGRQTRDFTFVSDVVAATIAAASAPRAPGRTYNVGGGSRIALQRAIHIIEEVSGLELQVERTSMQSGEVRDTGGDTEAASRDLDFVPTVAIEDGLRAEFEWMRDEITGRRTSSSPVARR
jgi:nucleoside-diphosphate-sugar epimerase